jgi:hypothetical protein
MKKRRRDDSYALIADGDRLGALDCGRIPPVAEAKDALVDRHDVDDELVPSPPAERRAWRGVLGKPQRAQPFREGGVLRV